jgi:hypothetical protein
MESTADRGLGLLTGGIRFDSLVTNMKSNQILSRPPLHSLLLQNSLALSVNLMPSALSRKGPVVSISASFIQEIVSPPDHVS